MKIIFYFTVLLFFAAAFLDSLGHSILATELLDSSALISILCSYPTADQAHRVTKTKEDLKKSK